MRTTSALTLTLSPGEREQPLPAFSNAEVNRVEVNRSLAKVLETILPLRSSGWRGKGRGEVRLPRLASLFALVFCFILLSFAFCLHAQSYSVDWHKIAGGGGTSTNSQYSLSGTIGQPDASGAMSSGPVTGTNYYSVTGGFWSLINVVQTAGLPNLVISCSGSNVIISWPDTGSYTLQQSADLGTAHGWTTSGFSISDDGTNKSITVTSPTGNLFFRLSNP